MRAPIQGSLTEQEKNPAQKESNHLIRLLAFLEEQKDIPIEYDEQPVRRLVEKVTVSDEKIAVKFKSGVEIEVDRKVWYGGILQVKMSLWDAFFRGEIIVCIEE